MNMVYFSCMAISSCTGFASAVPLCRMVPLVIGSAVSILSTSLLAVLLMVLMLSSSAVFSIYYSLSSAAPVYLHRMGFSASKIPMGAGPAPPPVVEVLLRLVVAVVCSSLRMHDIVDARRVLRVLASGTFVSLIHDTALSAIVATWGGAAMWGLATATRGSVVPLGG